MNAETLLKLIALVNANTGAFRALVNAIVGGPNPPTFENGTPITADDVDAAWSRADAPFARIEDVANRELGHTGQTPGGPTGPGPGSAPDDGA